jgi:hypothetical protein
VKAPRIPIRDVELPCTLICAVAVEAAKTHAATKPRRTNFLQFIALKVFKKLNPLGFEKYRWSLELASVLVRFDHIGSIIDLFEDI